MKTVSIKLLQDGPEFVVQSFSNTVQLAIGMRVAVGTVENWCSMPRVQVHILGPFKQSQDDDSLDLTDKPAVKPARVDALPTAVTDEVRARFNAKEAT